MKKINIFIVALITAAFISCGGSKEKSEPLTTQKIEAYLNSYKSLREKAPDFLNSANSGSVDKQKAGFTDFESEIKNNGMSYPEFVKTNAKVGAIYSILNAEDFMNQMAKMKDKGMEDLGAGAKEMQDKINDPNVPEEAKKELRKALEELKAAKTTINTDYDKNKYWADLVMDKAKSVTNMFIDAADVDVVKQNFDKITEAYTGGVVPTNFNVTEK